MKETKTLLYSVPIMGTDSHLGLWAGPDYRPQTATAEASGRIELRVMGLRSGGLFQRKVWPRRTMRARYAIAFADEVRNTFFPEPFSFEAFQKHCEWQVRNFYFGAHS